MADPLGAPMSDEEFEDEPELDDDDLEDDVLVDDLVEDDVDVADDADLLEDDLEVSAEIEVPVPVVTDDTASETPEEDDDDGVVDLDEELHPDDVEEPLDVLLQERTASAKLEDDEEDLEEEEADGDALADGPTRIVPRRPDEFLCQSCFLLLPLRRLADKDRQFCDDCA
jgi:Domain of unknown function (DUF4193)